MVKITASSSLAHGLPGSPAGVSVKGNPQYSQVFPLGGANRHGRKHLRIDVVELRRWKPRDR